MVFHIKPPERDLVLDLSILNYEAVSEIVTVVVDEVHKLNGTRISVAFSPKYVDRGERGEKGGERGEEDGGWKTDRLIVLYSTTEGRQRRTWPWPLCKSHPPMVPSSKRPKRVTLLGTSPKVLIWPIYTFLLWKFACGYKRESPRWILFFIYFCVVGHTEAQLSFIVYSCT